MVNRKKHLKACRAKSIPKTKLYHENSNRLKACLLNRCDCIDGGCCLRVHELKTCGCYDDLSSKKTFLLYDLEDMSDFYDEIEEEDDEAGVMINEDSITIQPPVSETQVNQPPTLLQLTVLYFVTSTM